jgi:hypothetical protein
MPGVTNIGAHGRSKMRKECASDGKSIGKPKQAIPTEDERRRAKLRALAARISSRTKGTT